MIKIDTLEKLKDSLVDNRGVITSEQAHLLGITNERMSTFARTNQLEKVARGIYADPNFFVDEMYVAQLSKSKMIYSHETALYLHDLTDRDPLIYSVTVPTGYNSKLLNSDFEVHSIKPQLHELGKTQLRTIYGNLVATYSLERTICDCLRSRNRMDIAIVNEAVKRYVVRPDKNLNTLISIATKLRIAKLVRSYMEILL